MLWVGRDGSQHDVARVLTGMGPTGELVVDDAGTPLDTAIGEILASPGYAERVRTA